MNDYQLAIKAINEAQDAGRLSELKRKVLAMGGVGDKYFWSVLGNNPSWYTKSWARLNREMPPKPPALIRGGDFDLRRKFDPSLLNSGKQGPISLHSIKLYECEKCHDMVKVIGMRNMCRECDPVKKVEVIG